MQPSDVVLVGLGGGAGSLLRWWIGRMVGERYHGAFPLGTFFINVSGAFVIGYLSVLFAIQWQDRFGTLLSAGILTGFLGGYTTFSSMQLDAAKLSQSGHKGQAVFYLIMSVGTGLIAAACGASLAGFQGTL